MPCLMSELIISGDMYKNVPTLAVKSECLALLLRDFDSPKSQTFAVPEVLIRIFALFKSRINISDLEILCEKTYLYKYLVINVL